MVERFKQAQLYDYNIALQEIKDGYKQSHWIWYIFPQLKELGKSATAKYYGLTIEEAKEYYEDKTLREHLIEITKALYNVKNKTITEIVGWDDIKIQSCMTLFYKISGNKIFKDVLDKYFNGELDKTTLELLGE